MTVDFVKLPLKMLIYWFHFHLLLFTDFLFLFSFTSIGKGQITLCLRVYLVGIWSMQFKHSATRTLTPPDMSISTSPLSREHDRLKLRALPSTNQHQSSVNVKMLAFTAILLFSAWCRRDVRGRSPTLPAVPWRQFPFPWLVLLFVALETQALQRGRSARRTWRAVTSKGWEQRGKSQGHSGRAAASVEAPASTRAGGNQRPDAPTGDVGKRWIRQTRKQIDNVRVWRALGSF